MVIQESLGLGSRKEVDHDQQMTPVDFEVRRSKDKSVIPFPDHNSRTPWPKIMKVGREVGSDQQMAPIDYEISFSKVKVTLTQNNKTVSG